MRSFLLLTVVGVLPAVTIAQRGGSWGGFGGGNFNHGGGHSPNTFITVVSAAPAAATSAAAAPPATSSTGGSTGSTGGSGAVSAAEIPPYGITPGVKANDGSANCVGDNGKAIP